MRARKSAAKSILQSAKTAKALRIRANAEMRAHNAHQTKLDQIKDKTDAHAWSLMLNKHLKAKLATQSRQGNAMTDLAQLTRRYMDLIGPVSTLVREATGTRLTSAQATLLNDLRSTMEQIKIVLDEATKEGLQS